MGFKKRSGFDETEKLGACREGQHDRAGLDWSERRPGVRHQGKALLKRKARRIGVPRQHEFRKTTELDLQRGRDARVREIKGPEAALQKLLTAGQRGQPRVSLARGAMQCEITPAHQCPATIHREPVDAEIVRGTSGDGSHAEQDPREAELHPAHGQ